MKFMVVILGISLVFDVQSEVIDFETLRPCNYELSASETLKYQRTKEIINAPIKPEITFSQDLVYAMDRAKDAGVIECVLLAFTLSKSGRVTNIHVKNDVSVKSFITSSIRALEKYKFSEVNECVEGLVAVEFRVEEIIEQ